VCSLDGLGYGEAGRVLAATDARRKEVYWAAYADGVRVAGPAVGRPEAVAAEASRLRVTRAVGDGAVRYADALGVPVADRPRYPRAAALAALAAGRVRAGAPSEPLTPLYLRRPDATLPGERKPVLGR
jgi:tRNA A37 threonylcarbamoyladenosine modification protein TsaB